MICFVQTIYVQTNFDSAREKVRRATALNAAAAMFSG